MKHNLDRFAGDYRPKPTVIMEDTGGKCVHRFEITDPLCRVCNGRDRGCDRYEKED